MNSRTKHPESVLSPHVSQVEVSLLERLFDRVPVELHRIFKDFAVASRSCCQHCLNNDLIKSVCAKSSIPKRSYTSHGQIWDF